MSCIFAPANEKTKVCLAKFIEYLLFVIGVKKV